MGLTEAARARGRRRSATAKRVVGKRERKPRTRKERSPEPFAGIPVTPSAFRFVWRTAELCRGRYVLADLTRVLVFDGTAAVLEPGDKQRERGCLACAVQHESRNYDCAGQRLVPAAVVRRSGDSIGYCPLTGQAVAVIGFDGAPEPTRYRRLKHRACSFRPIA